MVAEHYDSVIIGAGPAGSTTAALLAKQGHNVLILEKESFPRYIVGESMLPFCYFTLERLGVIEQLKASHFPKKYSVQFVSRSGNVSQPFYFFQHLEHECSMTWQVLRSEFDQMLLDNAKSCGAAVMHGLTARELIETDGTVTGIRAVDTQGQTREFTASVTIDASGRTGFTAGRKGWRIRDTKLKKVALWTYYKGAKRDSGRDEGATTVAYLPENGWFWYIPLPDDTVSVGIVADRDYLYDETNDPKKIFRREIEKNLWIKDHLAPGRQMDDFRVTGDYSYRSRYCAADGLVLVGDAFAFLDPVFSSGLFLALKSGELAADAIHAALDAQDVSAARFEDYGKTFCRGLEIMRKLVYAFYDPEFSFRKLLDKYAHLKGDLTDCLIGNLDKDFTELFNAAAEFAQIPEPLEHGGPLIGIDA